jgi:hypothetical protein
MRVLDTRVAIWEMRAVAVTSTGAWVRKGMVLVEPVPVIDVVATPCAAALRLAFLVPAAVATVLSTALRAAALTVAVEPVGRVTVSTRAPVGGGGEGG